jgi:GNAT superfamily N-acetyltransferase
VYCLAVRIRKGEPSDASAVIALLTAGIESYREFAPAGWQPPEVGPEEELVAERFLGDDRVWYVVAEDKQGHAGQCGFMPAHQRRNMKGDPVPGVAHFWQLFVRRDLWGGGLAADLHDRAIAAMRERGYTRARLLTPVRQARARAFYERRGWRESPFTVEDAEPLAGLPVTEYKLEL